MLLNISGNSQEDKWEFYEISKNFFYSTPPVAASEVNLQLNCLIKDIPFPYILIAFSIWIAKNQFLCFSRFRNSWYC